MKRKLEDGSLESQAKRSKQDKTAFRDIGQNCIGIAASFLTGRELFALVHVMKRNRLLKWAVAYVQDRRFLIKRVHAWMLKELGQDFLDLIVETGSVIAGGSLLNLLVDKPWVGGDIDIWVRQNQLIKIWDTINGQGWYRLPKNKNVPHSDESEKYGGLSMISRVADFVKSNSNSPIIQLVVLKTDSDWYQPTTATEHFDLDCCKVQFDGKDLVVHHVPSIMDMKMTVSGPSTYRRAVRIAKYRQRGFTIDVVE